MTRPSSEDPTGTTIVDVAAMAGVSVRTVSRVINGSGSVSAAARAQVTAAVEALAFRPSARARGLATGRSYLIGLLHNDSNALVLGTVQRGAGGEAARRGYELVVHPTPAGQEPSIDDARDFLRRAHVDGLVILPPVSGLPGLADTLAALGAKAVALSSVRIDGFPATLISNERDGAAEAARHLLDLGHRRIALISGPSGAHSARERRAGFVQTLSAAGCGLVGEAEGDYSFASGVAAAARLLDVEPAPTAIFASNDVMAAGVLKAAAARGLSVPGDLSVVGFDGSLLAQMLTPALTTVQRPLEQMAQQAVACLIDLIEGRPTDTDLRARLALQPGESTGPARA